MTPRFVREDGSTFGWRGATMFMLLARLMRGESIDPQFAWVKRLGINTLRVFCGGVGWGGEWEFFRRPLDRGAGFASMLRLLFRLATVQGVRIQAVCLTGNDTEPRRIVQTIYDVAQEFPLVSVEIANEPNVNNIIDTRTAIQGVNRHGVLSCSGDYLTIGTEYDPTTGQPTGRAEVGDGFMPSPPITRAPHMLDYGDLHTERSWHQPPIASDRYPRNGKEPLEFTDRFGMPWVDGEPLGFGEFVKVGSGARTTDITMAMGHHAIAHLLCSGSTLHTQAGLEGRAPDPTSEPIQTAMCEAIARMWQFIPEDCYLGTYSRPHLGNWPLTWSADDSDSLVKHAYASLHGNVGWYCVPQPRAGWVAQGVNGWRVTQQLDGFPFVGKVERG